MPNTPALSSDELKKRIDEEKALSGIIGRSSQAEAAKIDSLIKASQSQGLPSANPASVIKVDKPLTQATANLPGKAATGAQAGTAPAADGFAPPPVAASTASMVQASILPTYATPTEAMQERLTARSDTASIPNGGLGAQSSLPATGQNGEMANAKMIPQQARKEGVVEQPEATGNFISGFVEGVKKVYKQATAKPDYGAGFRDLPKYRNSN